MKTLLCFWDSRFSKKVSNSNVRVAKIPEILEIIKKHLKFWIKITEKPGIFKKLYT